MQNFKDHLNRTIHFKETPKRIISLVPSQTELLCDLGLEAYLVAQPNSVCIRITSKQMI